MLLSYSGCGLVNVELFSLPLTQLAANWLRYATSTGYGWKTLRYNVTQIHNNKNNDDNMRSLREGDRAGNRQRFPPERLQIKEISNERDFKLMRFNTAKKEKQANFFVFVQFQFHKKT